MRLGYETSDDLVGVGERGVMPSCITAQVLEPPLGWPAVSFTVTVQDGALALDCLAVERAEGGPPVSYSQAREALARLPGLMREAVDYWLSEVVAKPPPGEAVIEDLASGRLLADPSPDLVNEVLGDVGRRQPRPRSADRLAIVRAAHAEGGVTEVIDRLGVSRSQAYRLIRQARAEAAPSPGTTTPKRTRARSTRS